uniref:Acyl-CoA synthetase (AMP-forming)/AMP-acid ligase II n=1 Tax=uncultured Thiotrichaceae bacterium TaxID=298394 RepID=A0A6S6U9T9_9GAMM|nr:MAG: Acyl-CoA synthetase (AMP-forming)/AMP-acid ligase II [uncultured Thiotrichaceae bacterium]
MNDSTIRDLLVTRAQTTPDSPFLLNLDSTLTYAEVHKRVQAVAAAVSEAGVSKGRSVGFAATNSVELAITILGLFYGGFRATAINLVAGAQTIGYVLEHSECCLILHDEAGAEVLNAVEAASELPHLTIKEVIDSNIPSVPLNSLSPDDDGLLMYTSGTTGQPKGVRLSHQNLVAGGQNPVIAHQLVAGDRALCSLPLYHINALCVTLLAPLVSGGSVVFTPKFSTSSFWQSIEASHCTWFSLVPTQIGYLLNDAPDEPLALSNVRFGRSASAPLSPDVQAAFESCFNVPIIETMGLTETAAQILSNPLPPAVRKIGSPGIAFGNEVQIVDTNNKPVDAECEGEICIRGPNVMLGYLNNEQATQDTMDAEGWLHTGDLGKLDKDGYVFVTGRIKELIIKGGENIAPREVDEALLSHSAVLEAAAFAADCDRYGQKVLAAAVLKPGMQIEHDALIEHCNTKIGGFKSPQKIYFLDDLPKGPSGKVQRLKLGALLM